MVHAFLETYCCQGECQSITCVEAARKYVGLTSHGGAFFALACLVQAHARQYVYPGLRLGIFDNIIEEYDASKLLPTLEDWQALSGTLNSTEMTDLLSEGCEDTDLAEWIGRKYGIHSAVEKIIRAATTKQRMECWQKQSIKHETMRMDWVDGNVSLTTESEWCRN